MTCPSCNAGTTCVLDSRPSGRAIRRRRLCQKCRHRFTTYEFCPEERFFRIAVRVAMGEGGLSAGVCVRPDETPGEEGSR